MPINKKEPVSPFKKSYFISPQEFSQRIEKSPQAFREAGYSFSTLREVLNKINNLLGSSSLSESKISEIQSKLQSEKNKFSQEGKWKEGEIAERAIRILEGFKKGEF